jgi:hypothetical protein
MLILDSFTLPVDVTVTNYGAIAEVSDEANSGGVLATLDASSNVLSLQTSTTATIPTYTGSTVVLSAPDSFSAVTNVSVGGVSYTPALSKTPRNQLAGTYTFNAVTKEITLNVDTESPPIAGSSAVIEGLADQHDAAVAVPTSEFLEDAPQTFLDWDISGTVQRQRGFEEQPSMSFEFTTLRANENSVRSTFAPEAKLILFNVGYSVSSLTIERLQTSEYPQELINCQVSLTGYHVPELNRPISLRPVNVGLPPTLSDYARSAGSTYSGPTQYMDKNENAPSSSSTTLQQLLEDQARSCRGFLYYSEPSATQIRIWASTRRHFLSEADQVSSIQIQLNPLSQPADDGSGSSGGGSNDNDDNLLLNPDYQDTQLAPDPDPDVEDQQRNHSIWILDSDGAVDIPPEEFVSGLSSSADLRSPKHAFDNGGKTKTQTRTLYRNGSVQLILTETWGFAYALEDVYDIIPDPGGGASQVRYNPIDVSAYWQKIADSTETYFYSDEGYLYSVVKEVRQLARFKQEQNLETLELSLQPIVTNNDGVVIQNPPAERELYTNFFWTTNTDSTFYTLQSMVGIYPDIKRPPTANSGGGYNIYLSDLQRKYCGDEGDQQDASDWVEPRFASAIIRTQVNQFLTANPMNQSTLQLPPIVAGKRYREINRVLISYPYGQSEQSYIQDLDQYATDTQTENSEGQDYSNSLKISKRT